MGNESLRAIRVALAGNPNSGKTTIFNRITGEKRAVGNYSGVTVETVTGRFVKDDAVLEIADLPGAYSLATYSNEEQEAREFLLRDKPDVIVDVVDASNLERNLFLTLQLKELGLPLLVALNMTDLAASRGVIIDVEELSKRLDAPIVEVVGTTGQGIPELLEKIMETTAPSDVGSTFDQYLKYSKPVEREIAFIEAALDAAAANQESSDDHSPTELGFAWLVGKFNADESSSSERLYETARKRSDVAARRRWLAIKLLEDDPAATRAWNAPELTNSVSSAVERLSSRDAAPIAAKFAAERYDAVRRICSGAVRNEKRDSVLKSDRADRLLTHPFWGLIVFFATMYGVFWLTFTIGNYPVEWLESAQEFLSDRVNDLWSAHPDSLLRSLIVDGIIAGVGGVLVFFPNIFILFAAISALEESGYMARGAFLTDRFLTRFGLTGKSFIPMLVGFGCSIPAVMSTRIIEDRKSRLATIFVVPLMSCGARFPIYMLLIPAFFPEKWQACALWVVYIIGIVVAAALSTVVTSKTLKGETAPLLIELPPYHAPTLGTVGSKALSRGLQYLHKAGTVILGVSILLWALSTFPRLPQDRVEAFDAQEASVFAEAETLGVDLNAALQSLDDEETNEEPTAVANGGLDDAKKAFDESESHAFQTETNNLIARARQIDFERSEARLEYSFAGRLGKGLEPILKYAGFDWRIGTALVGAFSAKEVFVAQMGVVFKVGETDETSEPLRATLKRMYSPLVGACVIIFCLIAAPCMATVVVVAKETSWRWAFAQWTTLTLLGYFFAVVIYQVGRLLQIGV